MKASRAYIAGLGTTGVLLAFALLILVVFGATLAARGWPEAAAGGDAGAVRLDAGERSKRTEPVRREAAAAAPRVAARDASGRGVSRAASPERGGVRGTAGGGDAGTHSASQAAPAPSTAAPAPAAPATAPPVPSLEAPRVDLQTGAADAVGQATGGVAETAGGLVEETGALAERSKPALP